MSRIVGVPAEGAVGAGVPAEVDVVQDTRGRSFGTLFLGVVLMMSDSDRRIRLRLSGHPRQRRCDRIHLDDVDTVDAVDGNRDVTATA